MNSINNKGFSLPPTEVILDQLRSGFFILDKNWTVLYTNKSMAEWVRKLPEELIGFNVWEALPDAVGTKFYYYYHKVMEERTPVTFEEYYERTQGWLQVMVEPYNEGIAGYVTNLTENRKKEESINHIILHDNLTGLPNRNMFQVRLASELKAASEQNQSVALLLINLDRFKLINDTLGYSSGDILLHEVTKRIKISLDHQDILYRYGVDEFIVILSNTTKNKAAKVAGRIFKDFNQPFIIENKEIFTSLSIGISLSPDDGVTTETLIKHANFAMYQAKQAGTNTHVFYSPVKQETKFDPLQIEMELHKAIEQHHFSLYYQPKMDLRTGSLVGMEALIRWNHPKWGVISPEFFIRIAEETGLIIPIGEWVLDAACRQVKAWQDEGFSTVVAVNLSQKQFLSSDIVQKIEKALQTTGIAPQCLEIELTESVTGDIEQTILILQELKKLGVSISIDDFGTGFSSLNYLKRFPIDTLKIDLSFIRELHNNLNDETIVKTIISMAHHLNLKVVAEGIETKEQLLFLQQHLCDEGQGFFFSKPLPAHQLKETLFDVQQVVKEHGIPQDVSTRIWYEELLNQAKKELQDTVRMHQGMIFKYKKIDGDFVHTLCDGELLYRLGLTPAKVVGKRSEEFLPIENAERKSHYYERAWGGEDHVIYEDELNGIHYLASLRPIKKGDQVIEVIGSGVDITEKRKTEEQLAKAEKLAVVGELAAGVAHEIRNPLTSIKGFIQLFQQGFHKEEYFSTIFAEFQRLEDIIQEFLNLAKPHSNKLQIDDLASILEEIETLIISEANLKNIQISQEYHDELPAIKCDRNQVKQVFINIIKNSMEAIANEGAIKIDGSIEGDDVLIKIIDNGVGISEDRLKRLGEPFFSNKEKGTGLGLMICFKIVKEHGGTIVVKSAENQGTTVEVRFPILPIPAEKDNG